MPYGRKSICIDRSVFASHKFTQKINTTPYLGSRKGSTQVVNVVSAADQSAVVSTGGQSAVSAGI